MVLGTAHETKSWNVALVIGKVDTLLTSTD